MNKYLLEKAGVLLHGTDYKTPLARDLKVTERTVRRWIKGEQNTPELQAELINLLTSKKLDIESTIKELSMNTTTYILFNTVKKGYLESANSDYYKSSIINGESEFSYTHFPQEAKKYATLELAEERSKELEKFTKERIEIHTI